MGYLFACGRRWGDYFFYCFLRKHDWEEPDEYWSGFCEVTVTKMCKNCGATLRD